MHEVKLFKYIGSKEVSNYHKYIDMEGGKRFIITTEKGRFAIDDDNLSLLLYYAFKEECPPKVIGKIDEQTKVKDVKKYNRNFSRDDVNGIPWYAFVKRLTDKNYTTDEVEYITKISKGRLGQYARRYKVPKFGHCYVWTKSHIIDLCQRRYSKIETIKYEDDFYGV